MDLVSCVSGREQEKWFVHKIKLHKAAEDKLEG